MDPARSEFLRGVGVQQVRRTGYRLIGLRAAFSKKVPPKVHFQRPVPTAIVTVKTYKRDFRRAAAAAKH